MLPLRCIRLTMVAVLIALLPASHMHARTRVAPKSKAAPAPKIVPTPFGPGGKPLIVAPSAILMDVETGHILYSKNPHLRLPNASTTKIMTAVLLIENCKQTDTIKASKKACETPYTSLHLKPGETITARDLLMGLMVRSANDSAVAIAEHIAGNTKQFAKLMNQKAAQIGCKNTHFISPNGLYEPGHYSTAYDLCLMARYAFRYPEFNEAIATRKHFLESRTKNREDLAVFSHSRFLKTYPGADGVKSGYTKQAKRCYVGSATRDGWRLVSAVLGSSDANLDTAVIMDYGFAKFERKSIVRANEKCADAAVSGAWSATVPALAVKDLRIPVPKSGANVTTRADLLPLRAPVLKGAPVGTLKALVDGKEVASVPLKAGEDVGISLLRWAWVVVKWCGVIAVCLVGGIIGTAIAKDPRRRRRRVSSSMRSSGRWR